MFVYGINHEVVPPPPHLDTELFLYCQRQIAYSVPAFIVCALSEGSALKVYSLADSCAAQIKMAISCQKLRIALSIMKNLWPQQQSYFKSVASMRDICCGKRNTFNSRLIPNTHACTHKIAIEPQGAKRHPERSESIFFFGDIVLESFDAPSGSIFNIYIESNTFL